MPFMPCWLGASLLATTFSPNFQPESNRWSARVRADVMGRADFDPIVAPISNRSLTVSNTGVGHYSDSGTDVLVSVRFFKVEAVKPAEGSMRLKVWLRTTWVDDRLAWDPASFGGVTETYYRVDQSIGSEATEIWIPDLQPYNAVTGLVHSMEPAAARVDSNGTVFWSRPGSLDIMCKFSGLVAFPYDKLKCTVEIGGWSLGGGNQGLQLWEDGFSFDNQEVTSGASYQEYAIEGIIATTNHYVYPNSIEPWPSLVYSITMTRADSYYLPIVIWPGVLITLLSFAVFWTDTGSADALGYGIGVIVVNLLANFILIGVLPTCGEILWLDIFASVNTLFCCISLFQSAFNIMIENLESDHLLPIWIVYPLSRAIKYWRQGLARRKDRIQPGGPTDGRTESQDEVLSSASIILESVAGVLFRHQSEAKAAKFGTTRAPTYSKGEIVANSDNEPLMSPRGEGGSLRRKRNLNSIMTASDSERADRLIFFESAFYTLDENASLFIDEDECDLLLSYAALDLDPLARRKVFQTYDLVADGKLNRVEFVTMCVEQLWHVPIAQLKTAMENMNVARKSQTRRNASYWSSVATKTDHISRTCIPLLYLLALIIVFNLELSDNYDEAGAGSVMFKGLGPAKVSDTGVALIVVYVVTTIVIGASWFKMREMVTRDAIKMQQKLKIACQSSLEIYVAESIKGSLVASSEGESPLPGVGAQRRGPVALEPLGMPKRTDASLDPPTGTPKRTEMPPLDPPIGTPKRTDATPDP